MEEELNTNNMGNKVVDVIDDFSVKVANDANIIYTVDKIFTDKHSQEIIYNEVGKEVISDVFQGYNGTIFTYGVTGSGKTYTMFG